MAELLLRLVSPGFRRWRREARSTGELWSKALSR